MNKIMVLKGGSPAIHKLGDIGRSADEFIRIHKETEEYFIGNFEEGFGFIDVKFKKEDCRPLTEVERKELNGKWYGINGAPMYRIYVDEDGNVIPGKCIMKKGVISKVTNNDGIDKHPDFIGMHIEFTEDLTIGQSACFFLNDGRYITTSKIINVETQKGQYIIYTKNSVYYISA